MLNSIKIKYLLFILLFSSIAKADSYEIMMGSLTYHIFNPRNVGKRYSNKINDTGTLISNPLIGYRQVTTEGNAYSATMLFTGNNSIAEPIIGAAYSLGLTKNTTRIGLVGGLYLQDNGKMHDKGIGIMTPILRNSWGPIPIIGIEATETFDISKNKYILINGLITPILFNATTGIGWRF